MQISLKDSSGWLNLIIPLEKQTVSGLTGAGKPLTVESKG